MTINNELHIQNYIYHILDNRALTDETREAVEHYIIHSEYEMAFEGLFLDLMNQNVKLTQEEKQQALLFAENLGLNRETVFSHTFWSDFLDYLGITE